MFCYMMYSANSGGKIACSKNRKMPSNMEIKVKVEDLEKLTRKAEELSASEGEIIEQRDVFFNVPQGRLKLRYLQNRPSQLIFYERDDKSGPKMSNFHIATTNNPDDLADVLSHALGQKVSKETVVMLWWGSETEMGLSTVLIRYCQEKTSLVSCGSNQSTL